MYQAKHETANLRFRKHALPYDGNLLTDAISDIVSLRLEQAKIWLTHAKRAAVLSWTNVCCQVQNSLDWL